MKLIELIILLYLMMAGFYTIKNPSNIDLQDKHNEMILFAYHNNCDAKK